MPLANLAQLQLLEQRIREAIRGQDHVIPSVIERVTIGESGLATSGRPKGSFMFIGPTGVGKTELARVLAQSLYGDDEWERFDMAEFSADDAVEKFIGGPSGKLGQLGNVLSRVKRGFLLFDEIEKAHLDVIALFLSILDAGRITCGEGVTFDLSDFYIIFTSNLGALDILRTKHLNFTQIERHILSQIAAAFRPEFLGRIDAKLVFRKLAYEVQLEIAMMHLNHEQAFLAERGHHISFDGDVLTYLLQVGFDKYLGARPLRKAMEKHIRYPLARHLLKHGNDSLTGTLKVHAAKTGLIFSS